jgi:hypothetical protein
MHFFGAEVAAFADAFKQAEHPLPLGVSRWPRPFRDERRASAWGLAAVTEGRAAKGTGAKGREERCWGADRAGDGLGPSGSPTGADQDGAGLALLNSRRSCEHVP